MQNTGKKKSGILCLAVIIILTFIVINNINSQSAYAATKGICTAGTKLNIRTGPAETYAKVLVDGVEAYLVNNQEIDIISENNGWYQIKATFNGKSVEGYSWGAYISTYTVSNTPTPTATPTSTPVPVSSLVPDAEYELPATVDVSALNIRSAADTASEVLGTVYVGKSLTVVGETWAGTQKWYKVVAVIDGSSKVGYVFGDYLKVSPSESYYVQTASDGLNLRESASDNGILTKLKNGTAISLPDERSLYVMDDVRVGDVRWLRVRVTLDSVKYYGYIKICDVEIIGYSLTKATPTPTSTPIPTATPTPAVTATPTPASSYAWDAEYELPATVDVTTVNVRSDATTDSTKLGTVTYGKELYVIDEKLNGTEKWYRVAIELNGEMRLAYVYAPFVKLSTTRGFYAKTNTANQVLYESASETSATLKDSTGSEILLKKDRDLWVMEDVNVDGVRWFKIRVTVNSVKYYGYIKCDLTYLVGYRNSTGGTTVTPTPTPIPSGNTPTPTPAMEITEDTVYQIPAVVSVARLNLRTEANLTCDIISVITVDTPVVIIDETDAGGETWYKIAVKIDGKVTIGYVYSSYVKLTLSTPIEAAFDGKTKLRVSASTAAAYVKNDAGAVVTFPDATMLYLIAESTETSGKWFEVRLSYENLVYNGYIQASSINFVSPTPTPTSTPTPKPSATPTPTVAATATPVPPSATPTPAQFTGYGMIQDAKSLVVKQSAGFSSSAVKYDSGSPVTLASGALVYVMGQTDVDDITWYYIRFDSREVTYSGYVNMKYVETTGDYSYLVNGNTNSDSDFEAKLTAQGFPESYKVYLRALHEKYPNWEFTALHTGIDWETALNNEAVTGKNLLPNTRSIEWKSLAADAYNWKTDSFVVFDGSYWVTASRAALAYYMDPRNWLTESYIFQFEVLTYQPAYQTLAGVENILYGTPMYNTTYTGTDIYGLPQTISYAQTFIEAAQYSGVSPYHLASRVKQEVVKSSTTFSDSVTGKVTGWLGLYNFFNIGAYNSTISGGNIANGLKYARDGSTNASTNLSMLIPWTDPYRSIVGGSYFIGSTYISKGQDTIYLQKFNVSTYLTFSHEYMSNVVAPSSEGLKVYTAYGDTMNNLPIVFSIPVYVNMPSSAASVPATAYNPNNWLSSLVVKNLNGDQLKLTPSFDMTKDQEYSLIIDNSCNYVNILGKSVSTKASVAGTGYFSLEVGMNQLTVAVTAENGDVRNYVINIIRE